MSTKLYEGLRLTDPTADILELIPSIAVSIRAAFGEASRALVAEELARHSDGLRLDGNELPRGTVLRAVTNSWRQSQQSFGPHHSLSDPLRFSMVFGRSDRGNLLAYPFYSEPRYRVVLEAAGIFEDYHYQDQSDHPEEFSSEEWESRGREWDSLLNSAGTFGDLPTWELSDTADPFSEVRQSSYCGDDFDANLYLDGTERLRAIISNRLLTAVAEADAKVDPGQPATVEKIMGSLYDVRVAVSELFESEERSARLAPLQPLPKGLSFSYDELPRPYELDPSILAELIERVRERRATKTF